jgi:diguanylate cyclase (GGDEF)-like protein
MQLQWLKSGSVPLVEVRISRKRKVMRAQFKRKAMRAQFSKFLHDDVELEQAFIRCVLVLLVTLYLWTYPQAGPLFPGSPRLVSLIYLIISIPVFIWIITRPGQHHPRRITFTVLDQAMIAYAASFGEHTMPLIAISYWIIIGSGFRYGRGYLYLSAGTGMLGIFYNMAFSPHWAEYFFVGWSYLLSILIVTLYIKALLARVTETNLKLNDSLKHLSNLAHFDYLTGLPNRLALVERLKQSVAMTKRLRTNLSLIYFDLDGFKAVNDSLGHNIGDALLKEVAQRIKERIRSTDMLARIGGDEFVIVRECTHLQQDSMLFALTILDTIRGIKIEGLHKVTDNQIRLSISASIGISTYSPDISSNAPTVEEFIQRADDAMYLAKHAGKGCYYIWTEHTALNKAILRRTPA